MDEILCHSIHMQWSLRSHIIHIKNEIKLAQSCPWLDGGERNCRRTSNCLLLVNYRPASGKIYYCFYRFSSIIFLWLGRVLTSLRWYQLLKSEVEVLEMLKLPNEKLYFLYWKSPLYSVFVLERFHCIFIKSVALLEETLSKKDFGGENCQYPFQSCAFCLDFVRLNGQLNNIDKCFTQNVRLGKSLAILLPIYILAFILFCYRFELLTICVC